MSTRTQQEAGPPARGRRRAALAVALTAAVLAVAAAVGLGLGTGGEDPPAAAATPTAVPTPSAAPSTAPDPGTAPTTTPSGPPLSEAPALGDAVVADELPPSLAPVPLDGTAEAPGDGVSATLTEVTAVEGTGVGPGNLAGPALRIGVRVTNGSADAVDLDAVVVSAASGADLVPAPPLDDPATVPFGGSLAPGDSAEGVFVFTVPTDARDLVTVSVAHRAGAPFLVFAGPAD
jgi:hypothetical protein